MPGKHSAFCFRPKVRPCMAARYVGGVYVSRSHKGDPKAADPYAVVDAKKQRDAMKLVENQMFGDAPFEFPPSLYNHLASSRWDHWGTEGALA